MKKQILTAIAVMGCLCGYAQTKGTSAIGFGFNSQTGKSEIRNPSETKTEERKANNFSLGYGLFIKDNAKLGINLNYGTQDNAFITDVSGYKSKSYGAGVNYQQYYPLVKKLYAFAGAGVWYNRTKSDFGSLNSSDRLINQYSLGLDGGLTLFISKRFALETSLLSASAYYMTNKDTGVDNDGITTYKNTDTNFSLNTSGVFRDLGFKIYLLF